MANNRAPLSLTYDNLVVGSSLEALLFAVHNNLPVVYVRNCMPLQFEELEDFGLGINKQAAWKKLAFQLSLAGKMPFENKLKVIRYMNDKTLKAVTEDEYIYIINFKELYVFDDYCFDGLPPHKGITTTECMYLDHYRGKNAQLSLPPAKGKTAKLFDKIFFFNNRKIVTVNYVQNIKKAKPEYVTRIKLSNRLKNPLEHIRREIIEFGRNIYDNFDNVTFVYNDAKWIYNFINPRRKIDYMKYLRLKLEIK